MTGQPPRLQQVREPAPDSFVRPQEPERPRVQGYDAADYALGIPQQEKLLMRSFNAATAVDPERAAEARRLGIELGLQPDVVERNIDKVKRLAAIRQLERRELAKHNPILARQFADPEFAKLAHDDLEELSHIEGLMNGFVRGWLENELAVLHERQASGDSSPKLQQQIDSMVKRLHNVPTAGGFRFSQLFSNPDDALMGIVSGGGQMVGQLLPSLRDAAPEAAIGALIGTVILPGPGTAVGAKLVGGAELARQFYIQERGASYAELRNLGIDHYTAANVSAGVGVFNAAAEFAGFWVVTAAARAGLKQALKDRVSSALRDMTVGQAAGRFVTGTLKASTGEMVTEMIQEVSNFVGEEVALHSAGQESAFTNAAMRESLIDRMWAVGQEAFGSALLLGGAGAGVRFAADLQRVETSKLSQQFVQDLAKGVEKTKLSQRARDKLEQFLARLADGSPVENLYFDAKEFDEVLEQAGISRPQLRKVLPEVEAQIDEAKSTGGDIVIPTAQYASRIARTPLHESLAQSARITPDSPSLRQVSAEQAAAEQLAKDAQKVLQKQLKRSDEFAESARLVRENTLKQARETGQFRNEEARAAASVFQSWAVVVAEKLGRLPHQVAEMFPFRLAGAQEAAAVEGASLAQTPDVFDPVEGLGAVPDQQEIDARGFTRTLSPEQFLQLAARKDQASAQQAQGSIAEALEEGKKVAPPFLNVEWDADANVWRVKSHEGRSRSVALQERFGNVQMPVHFFVRGVPAQEVTEEMRRAPIVPEEGGEPITITDPSLQQPLSTRLPSGVKATENPHLELLFASDVEVALADKPTLAKNANTIRGLPFMRIEEGLSDEEVVEAYIQHVTDNLEWLLEQMPAQHRNRSRKWYIGGNTLIQKWARRYGLSDMQVAGVIAALSPRQEWFSNMTMAERVMDIVLGQSEWTDEMTTVARRMRFNRQTKRRELLVPRPKKDFNINRVLGKKLSELDGVEAAYWVRVYDQAHNTPEMRALTPEGHDAGQAKRRLSWASYPMLAKAVSIVRNGTAENVSQQLGAQHKVRSFFNNLLAPDHGRDVTLDTHAVAAGYFLPVAGSSDLVKQVWGEKGGATSRQTGLLGFYPFMAEAYRRVAENHGMLPREVQSITWEQVRTIFTDTRKRNPRLLDEANAIWARYRAGDLDAGEARDLVREAFGEPVPLTWAETGAEGEVIDATYDGQARSEFQDRDGAVEASPRIAVEARPNLNPELLAEWDQLSEEQRAGATNEILTRVAALIAEELDVEFDVRHFRGGWEGTPEASIGVLLNRPETSAQFGAMLGELLFQESVFVISATRAQGLDAGSGLLITLPEGYTTEQIDALYRDVLWPTEVDDGKRPITGHSTEGRHMVIGIDEAEFGVTARELTTLIADRLSDHPDQGRIEVQAQDVFLKFLHRGEHYGQDQSPEQSPARRPPIATRSDRLADQSNAIYRDALDRVRGREPALAQRGGVRPDAAGSGRAGGVSLPTVRATPSAPVYGTAREGSVSVAGIHFSRAARDSLDARKHGTGLRGGERNRIAGDPLLTNRIYYYVDVGEGVTPELGVGSFAHETRLDNVYDVSADPLGLVSQILERGLDPSEATSELERAAHRAGFDGVFDPNSPVGPAAILIGPEHTQVPVARVERRLQQRAQEEKRGEFFPRQLTAVMHEGADFSTLMHEMSHYFFEVHERLLAQPDPPQSLLDDFNTFLEWTGVESLEAWRAMTFEERRPHTEAFAFAFEVYLFEGRAPSTRMARLFDTIRKFMVRVYQDILATLNPIYREQFGRDLPALTPEIRSVFDRMLAAEQEVRHAESVRGFTPLFQTQEESGMSDEEWNSYQQALDEAREAAVTEVTQASLKQMQWLSRARGKVLKALQKTRDKIRKRIAGQVEEEVRERPVYRALRYLRRGEIDLEKGGVAEVEGPHKLSTEAVRPLLPEDATLRDVSGLTAAEGLDPQLVAEMFGFETGRDLVEALVRAPAIEEEITTQTDIRMVREHSELTDPEAIERVIQEALHNEARARFVAVELRFLQKIKQPVRVTTAAAKLAARQILSRKKVRDIRVRDFEAAERRAARAAEKAAKEGDPVAAITAKHQELLQHYLAKEAIEIRKQLQKSHRFFREFNKTDKQLAKSRNVDYVGVGRAILAHRGLGPPATPAKPHLEQIQQHAPELLEDLQPMIDAAMADELHWKDMTWGDFQVVEDTLRALWFQSRRDKTIEVAGEQVERETIVETLLAALQAPDAERRGRTLSPKERRRVDFGDLLAWFKHVEAWAIARDGGEPGPIHQYLFALLREPVNAYESEKITLVRELHRRINGHDFGDPKQEIKSHELNFTFRNKAELVGALRHAGSNLRRLLIGHGMVPQPEKPGAPIDTSKWWAFIDRMIEVGREDPTRGLTKADFDLVQHIWDIYDNLLPRSQKAHFDVYGYRFEEIQKQPIQTPWGEYSGGYVPLKYDPYATPSFFKDDPLKSSSEEYRRSFPSTGRGHTLTRVTEFKAELLLDITMDAHTLDEHLRFIHLQRPGRDLLRLLRDKRIEGALNRINPSLVEEMFIPWVGSVLKNRLLSPGGPRKLNEFLKVLRRRSGLATMFANVSVGVQQLTGIGNALLYVDKRYLAGAAALYLRHLFDGKLVSLVKELSEFMDLRLGKGLGQIRDDIDVMLKPGWVSRAEAWSLEHGYFIQRWFQQPVDVITWKGRYDQSIAQGKSEAQAVSDADAAVRRSQSSGQVADLSRLEKGHPLVRLLMQFSSYWVTTANAVLHKPTLREKITAGAVAVAFAGLAAGAVTQALRGGWDDEDGDGSLWDDVTAWAFGDALQAAAGIVAPSFGPNLLNPLTGEFGGRITLGAGVGALERGIGSPVRLLLNATDDKREVSGRDVRDLGMLLSLILGIPVTGLTDRARFLLDEDQSVRGAVVGR